MRYPKKKALNQKLAKTKLWQLRKYGMDEHSYLRLLEKTNGRCVICKQIKRLVIDHCHTSNRVRGLICGHCNSGLGQFKDNIQALLGAIQYLVDFYHPK